MFPGLKKVEFLLGWGKCEILLCLIFSLVDKVLLRVFTSCKVAVSSKGKFVAFMNLLFFGGFFVTALVARFLFPPPLYLGWRADVPEFLLDSNWPLMLLGIFFFNLALSAFVFVTLPGFVFFPFSAATLLYRAILWGTLLQNVPNWLLIAVLLTLILEGEAYVFASVAGSIVGLSWIKPTWLYRQERLSRKEAIKCSLKEAANLYLVVVLFLVVAAIVETATIFLLV